MVCEHILAAEEKGWVKRQSAFSEEKKDYYDKFYWPLPHKVLLEIKFCFWCGQEVNAEYRVAKGKQLVERGTTK